MIPAIILHRVHKVDKILRKRTNLRVLIIITITIITIIIEGKDLNKKSKKEMTMFNRDIIIIIIRERTIKISPITKDKYQYHEAIPATIAIATTTITIMREDTIIVGIIRTTSTKTTIQPQ